MSIEKLLINDVKSNNSDVIRNNPIEFERNEMAEIIASSFDLNGEKWDASDFEWAAHCLQMEGYHKQSADVIAIPCKIGDTVYAIRRYNGERSVKQGKVSQMFFTDDMELCIVVAHIARGLWGKAIFGSEAEAWAMIEKRNR